MFQLEWNRLLSDWRCPSPGNKPHASKPEEFRSPFEADCDRIVYSPPFRRLARKTQVHAMAVSDHVHNRLTHSIEVASAGRSLARRLSLLMSQRNELPADRTAEDLCQIVQAACLAHDIGNPPFGHGGEYAIRQWVSTFPEKMFGQESDSFHIGADDPLRNDWRIFEGNAQGFRLAARADNPQQGYMRLTYASLGAMIKYPWDACDDRAKSRQKFNVFSSEQELFRELVDHMGLRRQDGQVVRHPLAFLSEAADDICYRIIDLEDAVEMGILEENAVRPVLSQFLETSGVQGNLNQPLPIMRAKAIGGLLSATWQVFEEDYLQIMRGERETDLKSGLDVKVIEAIKRIDEFYEAIFAYRAKVANELGAYAALGRILEKLCQATQHLSQRKQFKQVTFVSRRILQLAWGEAYVVANEHQDYRWWLHQVMDYVAALTDNYARQLSREIAGV